MKQLLVLILFLIPIELSAQIVKEFKLKDSTVAGTHIGVPMIPGSRISVPGNGTGANTDSLVQQARTDSIAALKANKSDTLNQLRNVLAYGVKNDSTAQSANLQTVLNLGGTIRVPNGNYGIDATLVVYDNTTIEMEDGARFYAVTNLNAPIIRNADTLNGNTNINIRGGIIDGNKTNQNTTSLRTAGIWFKKVTNSMIQNINVKNAKGRTIGAIDGANINLDTCSYIDVANVNATNSANTGLIAYGGHHVSVYGGHYSNNAVTGLDFAICPKSRAIGVTADTNGSSGISTHSQYTSIIGCNVDSAVQAINAGEDTEPLQASYSVIALNTVQHANFGIQVQGTYTVGVQVYGNLPNNNYILDYKVAATTNTSPMTFVDSTIFWKGFTVGDVLHAANVYINAHAAGIALELNGDLAVRGRDAGIRLLFSSVSNNPSLLYGYNNTGTYGLRSIVGGVEADRWTISNGGVTTALYPARFADSVTVSGKMFVHGTIDAQVGASTGARPTFTAASLIGEQSATLGSGTGKVIGVLGIARGNSDAVGDRAYGGWFKAVAQTRDATEVGVHAEVGDVGGMIAEFYLGTSVKDVIQGNGYMGINTDAPGTWALNVNGDIYAADTISGGTLVDRTPGFEGNASLALKGIKSKKGQIDHSTLPPFLRASYNKPILSKDSILVWGGDGNLVYRKTTRYERADGRNLGNAVTMLIKAFQEQATLIDSLQNHIIRLESNK